MGASLRFYTVLFGVAGIITVATIIAQGNALMREVRDFTSKPLMVNGVMPTEDELRLDQARGEKIRVKLGCAPHPELRAETMVCGAASLQIK